MRGDNGDGLSLGFFFINFLNSDFLGAVLSRSVTALVEDATEMADREAANALYELDMREWEGADLPVHHLRFRGLQRAATSLTHLQEFMFEERLRQDARGWVSD